MQLEIFSSIFRKAELNDVSLSFIHFAEARQFGLNGGNGARVVVLDVALQRRPPRCGIAVEEGEGAMPSPLPLLLGRLELLLASDPGPLVLVLCRLDHLDI